VVTLHATVRDWRPSRGGSALLDDGTPVRLPLDCLQGSVFRFLRPGQRIRVVLVDDEVTEVGLPV
jgi:hypothetical protein